MPRRAEDCPRPGEQHQRLPVHGIAHSYRLLSKVWLQLQVGIIGRCPRIVFKRQAAGLSRPSARHAKW